MNRSTVIYSYVGILSRIKINTAMSKNEFHKHKSEWKKPETKEYMLYDSISIKFTKKKN